MAKVGVCSPCGEWTQVALSERQFLAEREKYVENFYFPRLYDNVFLMNVELDITSYNVNIHIQI